MRHHLEAFRYKVTDIVSRTELDDNLAVDLGEVEVGVGLHDPQLALVVDLVPGPY